MNIRDYISSLFNYRVKNGEQGWDEFAQSLGPSGAWSITGSPKKFQDIILDLIKRIERLEDERDSRENNKPIQSTK